MSNRAPIIRPPAVAGTFYPSDPDVLRAEIRRAFDEAVPVTLPAVAPAGLIVPHAGYVYSGPIAASAYQRLEPAHHTIRRVVVLGPAHRVPLRGLGLSSADAWETPLGLVPLDRAAAAIVESLPGVEFNDRAHGPEHSLEVQLPFLQTVLDDFALVPLVVGDATPDEVVSVLDALWTGPDTLVVVSTDLSHYHRYDEAVEIDTRTVSHIAAREPAEIGDRDACGARPLRGLLAAATARDAAVIPLDVRNSGDTAGGRERVVGYGAFGIG